MIRILHELATKKDVKRLNAYCKNDTYNKYLGDDDFGNLRILELCVPR